MSIHEKLKQQNDTQAETIQRQWLKISRLKRERDWLKYRLAEEIGREPTKEEIAEAVFGGQANGKA